MASPRLLCLVAAFIAMAVVMGMALASPAQAAVSYSSAETEFINQLNNYRQSKGLQPLLVSDMLSESGDRHSSDMGKYKFFDHNTVQSDWFEAGATPWDRMAASGYNYNTYKGENIAAGYSTASAVFTGWKNSAGHNANMLGANFKVVGVSLVTVAGSPYGSYWTTDFGGYVDATAHNIGSGTTTTTVRPTTTTVRPTTTTTARTTTTTIRTTTTTRRATTTTVRPTTTTMRPTTTTTVRSGHDFSDVTKDTPYAGEIGLLALCGIVTGYGDGTFGPSDPVLRQQFAKMIILSLGLDPASAGSCKFTDVQSGLDPNDPSYATGYVAACAANGIVQGKTAYTFGSYDKISRAQMITMVARAAQLPATPAGYKPPFDNFDPDHYPWAARAAYAGLLDGFVGMGPDFNFWIPATRAEVCLMLSKLIDQ